jgi:hypothetical protein
MNMAKLACIPRSKSKLGIVLRLRYRRRCGSMDGWIWSSLIRLKDISGDGLWFVYSIGWSGGYSLNQTKLTNCILYMK